VNNDPTYDANRENSSLLSRYPAPVSVDAANYGGSVASSSVKDSLGSDATGTTLPSSTPTVGHTDAYWKT
jgi:hypothetical protein